MSSFVLHLLRHGAPETPGLLLGHADVPSSPEGIAACLEQVADLSFTALLSSDLIRASAAADAIGSARGLPVQQDARWRELDFGAWDGLAPARIDSAAMGAFWNDPDADPPPGGERWSALVARVSRAVAELEPAPTLIVTHGGAIRAALHGLCGFERRSIWSFDLPYGVLVSLRLWPGDAPVAQITALRP